MFSRKMGDVRNDPFFKPCRIGGAFFRHEGFRRQSLSVRAPLLPGFPLQRTLIIFETVAGDHRSGADIC
jgi:hypothetical protein